jgi:hypothetical protein
VGRVSTVLILSKLKTNLKQSFRGDFADIRMFRILAKWINQEKRKILGHSSTIPKSAEYTDQGESAGQFHNYLSKGGVFIRFCDNVDDQKRKLMMLFMINHGRWVLGQSMGIFSEGTLIQLQSPSQKIYFIRDRQTVLDVTSTVTFRPT